MTEQRITVLDIDFDAFIREPPVLDWGHSEMGLFQDIVWHPRAMGWASNPHFNLGEILTPPNGPHLEGFWDRMARAGWQFTGKTWGIAGDSHATVGVQLLDRLLDGSDAPITIYHVDAHHDLGYSDIQVGRLLETEQFSCDSWLYLLPHHLEGCVEKIVVVYPEWRREPCPVSKMRIDEGYEELLQRRAEDLWQIGCELEIVYWNDLVIPEDHIDGITMAQSSAWVPPWFDAQFEQWVEQAPCGGCLSQYFGPDQEAQFERRQGWPNNWADVKETYTEIRNLLP